MLDGLLEQCFWARKDYSSTFEVEYFLIFKTLCECPQLLKMHLHVALTSKFLISRQILEITAEAIVSVFVSVMTLHNS